MRKSSYTSCVHSQRLLPVQCSCTLSIMCALGPARCPCEGGPSKMDVFQCLYMCWPYSSRHFGVILLLLGKTQNAQHCTLHPPRICLPGFRDTDGKISYENFCAFATAVVASPSLFLLTRVDAFASSLKVALIICCAMGGSRPQATQAGPAQALASDLQYVRKDQQQAASSTQQSSYVPPHPHVQATQTFFDPEPAPAAAAAPAPVAQGYSVGAINTTQPLYCPAPQVIRHSCSASYCQF